MVDSAVAAATLAAPGGKRSAVDPLTAAVARLRDAPAAAESDWTRPTTGTAVSLGVHFLMVLVLAVFMHRPRKPEFAEPVVVEVDPNAVVALFDNTDGGFEAEAALAQEADANRLPDRPLKMESQANDAPDVKSLDPGAPNTANDAGAGAKAGAGAADGVGGAAGGGQAAGVMGLTAKGRRVVFVVDRSASMKAHDAIEFAKDELIRAINRLRDGMMFQLVYYSDEAHTLNVTGRRDMIPASERNRDRAVKFVRDLPAEGGTMHLKALQEAFDLKPDLIFFITDADDDSEEDIKRLNKAVERMNRGQDGADRASIHVIQLWHQEKREPNLAIKKLADDNRGAYKLIRTYEAIRQP